MKHVEKGIWILAVCAALTLLIAPELHANAKKPMALEMKCGSKVYLVPLPVKPKDLYNLAQRSPYNWDCKVIGAQ